MMTYTIKKLEFERIDDCYRAVSPFCLFEIHTCLDHGKFFAFAVEKDEEYLIGVSTSFSLAEKSANEHFRVLLESYLEKVESEEPIKNQLDSAYDYVDAFALMDNVSWYTYVKWLRTNARIIEIQATLSPDEYEDAQPLYEWLEEIR